MCLQAHCELHQIISASIVKWVCVCDREGRKRPVYWTLHLSILSFKGITLKVPFLVTAKTAYVAAIQLLKLDPAQLHCLFICRDPRITVCVYLVVSMKQFRRRKDCDRFGRDQKVSCPSLLKCDDNYNNGRMMEWRLPTTTKGFLFCFL